MLPEIIGLKHKVKTKFEIEKYVTFKNNNNLNVNGQLTVICGLIYISFL